MTATGSTIKKSFFINYFRYKLKKNKNLFIISVLFSALCIPLFAICMSICIGMVNTLASKENIEVTQIDDLFSSIDTVASAGLIISAISAAIVLLLILVIINSVFSYNLKKCDADMYLSLPLTASQRFFGDFLAGAVIGILPMTVFGGLSAAFTSVSGINIIPKMTDIYLGAVNNVNDSSGIGRSLQGMFSRTNNIVCRGLPEVITYIFIALTVVLVFTYLFCVLVNSFVGRTSDYLVYTLIAVAAVSVIVASFSSMAVNRVTNSMSNEEFCSAFMFASPVGMAFSLLASFIYSFNEPVYSLKETDGVPAIVENERYNMFSVFNIRNIVVIILIFALLLILAYVLTRFRKAEKTGSHFVYELPYHIISLSVICAIFCIDAGTNPYNINTMTTDMVCVVISAVVYFFTELTHGRKFKKMWQSLLRYVGAIAGTLLLCTVVKNVDVFGLEHYIPSVDNIKSVEISTNKAYSDNGNSTFYTAAFKDKEIITAIEEYHSFIVGNGYAFCNSAIMNERFAGTDNSTVRFIYELKDGRTVTRDFNISVNYSNYGDYAKALYDMRYTLSKTDEYIDSIVKWEPDDIKFFTRTGDFYGRKLNENVNGKLLTAIENDYKAGRNTGKLMAVTTLDTTSDYLYSGSISVEIRENCTETLAVLNDEANSVSLKQSVISTAKEELKAYMESEDYDGEENPYFDHIAFIYSIKDLTSSQGAYTDYIERNIFIIGADVKSTNIYCDYAESESITELEKLFVMYDYYTDGLISNVDYVISDVGDWRTFGGAYYSLPENKKLVLDLLTSIRKEFNIPIEQ